MPLVGGDNDEVVPSWAGPVSPGSTRTGQRADVGSATVAHHVVASSLLCSDLDRVGPHVPGPGDEFLPCPVDGLGMRTERAVELTELAIDPIQMIFTMCQA